MSFRSISSSLPSTRSSIFRTEPRRSASSASIWPRSWTACSRASICASRRTASASRSASSISCRRTRRALPTPVAPKTWTASRASAAPAAIPMATAIPISTCGAPRSVGFSPTRHRAHKLVSRIARFPARSPLAPPHAAPVRTPWASVVSVSSWWSMESSQGQQFERAQFAGKMSGEDAWILARLGLVRKSRQVFERGGVEAARAEPADRSRPWSPELQQFPGPRGLRLEPGEGRGHGLGPEPLALEREANRCVAVPSRCKGPGPRGGNPPVVDETGLLERLEHVSLRLCPGSASGEPLLEPAAREVAVAERSHRDPERLGAPQLPAERPRRLAIECSADEESRAHHCRRRHEPPRDAVELHLDSVARPLAQRRDDGHYSADSASPAATTAAAAAAAFAPLPLDEPFSAASSTTGSSRAETTCSGPSSSWMRWRICCVTSGCSRRNAVAFCRPWPSRSSPKLKYEPDFATTLRSIPVSRTVPSHEMPEP